MARATRAFSYDLAELGRFYLAFRRLLEQWQMTMPGFVYDVSYEQLRANHLHETRKLLDYCGVTPSLCGLAMTVQTTAAFLRIAGSFRIQQLEKSAQESVPSH
jgi:hypothetical protein